MFGLTLTKKFDATVGKWSDVCGKLEEIIRRNEEELDCLRKKLNEFAYDRAALCEDVERLSKKLEVVENALKFSEQTRKKAVKEREHYKTLYEALEARCEGEL